jgi:hypothetical protein
MSIPQTVLEVNLEGMLLVDQVTTCQDHRANSLEEAFIKVMDGNDFIFFPMDSIDSNLKNIVKLFDGLEMDMDCSIFRCNNIVFHTDHKVSADYCIKDAIKLRNLISHEINQLGNVSSVNTTSYDFEENIFLSIENTLKSSYANIIKLATKLNSQDKLKLSLDNDDFYLGKFINPANNKFNDYNDYFAPTYNWHFDDEQAINILVPFTSPGTEFCVINYNRVSYDAGDALSEEQSNELLQLCEEQIKTSNFKINKDEAVIFKTATAFHRTPQFTNGRFLALFPIRLA